MSSTCHNLTNMENNQKLTPDAAGSVQELPPEARQARIKEILARRTEIFDKVGIVEDIPVIRYGGEEAYEQVRKKICDVMPEVARLYVEFLTLEQPEVAEKTWDTDLSSLKKIERDYDMGSSVREGAPPIEEVVEFAERYVDRSRVDEDIYPRKGKYPYAFASAAWPPKRTKHKIVANYRGGVRDALDLAHEYGHIAQFQRMEELHEDVDSYKEAVRRNGFVAAETAAIAIELKMYGEKELATTGEDPEKSYLINVPRYEFERRAIEAVHAGALTTENAYEYLRTMWGGIKSEYFGINRDGDELDPLLLPHPFIWPGGKNIGYVVAYLAAKNALKDERVFNGILEGKYSEEELLEIAGLTQPSTE